MKKYIISCFLIIFLPVGITFMVSVFSSKIYIGMGSMSVEDHLLGRRILLETNGLYKDMDVEEYVLGVMPGVIAPDYDMESLKVFAILIRTNILKEMQEENTSDAEDLSYDYLTAEDRKEIWGERNYDKYEKRMETAVVATAGQVIYYNEEMIMALYHEVSIGKTVSAKEILGEEIPYLQSVESSQDVEAKQYMNIIEYPENELLRMFLEYQEMAEENTENNTEKIEISIEESSDNGYVKKVIINGNSYSGEEVMNMFDLPSLNYYVEKHNDGIRFVCLGKGMGMGVSMYGSNYLAQNGKTMEEIISYYYQNVRIQKYN